MKERPRGKPLSRGSAARTTQVHVGSRPHGAAFVTSGQAHHGVFVSPCASSLELIASALAPGAWAGPTRLSGLGDGRCPPHASRARRRTAGPRRPRCAPLRTALPLPTNGPSSHPAFSVHLSIFQKTNFNITAYKDFLNLQKLNPSSTFDTTQRSRALRLPPPAPLGERTAPCAHEALRDRSVDDWVGAEADGTTYCEARKQADRHALI